MFKRLAITVIGGLVLAGCVTGQVPKQAVKLNGDEIQNAYSGKSAYGKLADKNWNLSVPIVEYYAADTRVAYKENKLNLYGTWRVKDDLLCTRYFTANSDKEYCWEIYSLENKSLVVHPSGKDSGKVQAEFDIFKDGDVEKLIN
ncbi:hypothetical protein [Curvivirga aplysinae]|uniref:hypothetical protein n=1 Tax=Curvivirga aplysinae TaxID=2529852 RepID=UPI0012BC453F|nr:hypothetical protein [Curvivirga aplysinae]MTI10525.1 hypothetical protein [Curvivirga aplysinae]